jgi:hypothetical protein
MGFEKEPRSASSFHDSPCGEKAEGKGPRRDGEDQKAGYREARAQSLCAIRKSQAVHFHRV